MLEREYFSNLAYKINKNVNVFLKNVAKLLNIIVFHKYFVSFLLFRILFVSLHKKILKNN